MKKSKFLKSSFILLLALVFSLPVTLVGCGKGNNNSRVSGLYQNGVLIKTWNELVENGGSSAFGQNSIKSFPRNYEGELVIDSSITTIEEEAFKNSKLSSITIPNSVTTIGDHGFYACESLKSISIPKSVTSFGSYAFAYCDNLKSSSFENGLTTIGDYAFRGCNSLESVVIPESVTRIGTEAFNNCNNLASVTIKGIIKLSYLNTVCLHVC